MEDLLIMHKKRRGMKCVRCGTKRLMTGRQRKSKTLKPICQNCGSTQFEIAKRSKLHNELDVTDKIYRSLPKIGSGKKRYIR